FYGTNVNQRAVGTGLDNAINAGGYNQRIYNIAGLPPAQMANALTQLSGEVHTQSSRAAFQHGDSFLSAMMDPFAGDRGGGGFGAMPGDPAYGNAPYGAPQNGSYGGNGGPPYGSPGYDPQYPNGNYDPSAGQQYGDAQYGNPNYPGAPYAGAAPNGGN